MNRVFAMLRRPAFRLAVVGIVGATGLALGNGWITGATLVTLLIAAAPCLIMCALGLCMKGADGASCKQGETRVPTRTGDADPR